MRRADPEALKEVLGELGVTSDGIPKDEDSLVELVTRQFTTPFSNKGELVPAVVGGADLVAFFLGWATHSAALIALDLHTRRTVDFEEEVPKDPAKRMTYQKSSWAGYWLSQYLTQMIMDWREHKLAAILAGFRIVNPTLLPGKDTAANSLATYEAVSRNSTRRGR